MIKFKTHTYKLGQHFRLVYLGNMLFKYVAMIDKENGKKLAKPYFTFEQMKDEKKFNCRQEDVDRSFLFGDWIPVKVDSDGNVTDIL